MELCAVVPKDPSVSASVAVLCFDGPGGRASVISHRVALQGPEPKATENSRPRSSKTNDLLNDPFRLFPLRPMACAFNPAHTSEIHASLCHFIECTWILIDQPILRPTVQQ